jgi:ATP-dependent Clp protease protease subunit
MKIIVIDSFIGSFGYSKQYVRNLLAEAEKDAPVECHISSLGGSVDHAIAIHDLFAERGNIHSKLTGFIASAATFIALPTKTRISENSFYLIHKVLSWIDEFGMMNEDDIEELIEKLKKNKDENAKMTLVLAKRYAERAKTKGKTIQDVLELMKKDTWLTADEALEWGFVDEVYKPDAQLNYFDDLKLVAMVNAAGLPTPKRQNNPKKRNINQETMKTQLILPNINAILGITELMCDDEGSYIQTDQLNAIELAAEANNQRILELEAQNQSIEQLNEQLNERVAELEQINQQATTNAEALQNRITELETENANIAQLNQRIAELVQSGVEAQTQISTITEEVEQLRTQNQTLAEKLAKVPAKKAILLQASEDPNMQSNTEDWNTINSLPHNQNVE